MTAKDVDLFISGTAALAKYTKSNNVVVLDEDGEPDDNPFAINASESPAQYATRMRANRQTAAAFAAAKLDPSAYGRAASLMAGAMFGAAMAQGKDPKNLPQPVQYLLANRASIEARMKAIAN